MKAGYSTQTTIYESTKKQLFFPSNFSIAQERSNQRTTPPNRNLSSPISRDNVFLSKSLESQAKEKDCVSAEKTRPRTRASVQEAVYCINSNACNQVRQIRSTIEKTPSSDAEPP